MKLGGSGRPPSLPNAESAAVGGSRERGTSLGAIALAQFRQSIVGLVGLVLVLLFLAVTAAAPWLAPYGYNDQNLDLSFHGPSLQHPFGTDRLGRDTLSIRRWLRISPVHPGVTHSGPPAH